MKHMNVRQVENGFIIEVIEDNIIAGTFVCTNYYEFDTILKKVFPPKVLIESQNQVKDFEPI